jgi:hypothetical protein
LRRIGLARTRLTSATVARSANEVQEWSDIESEMVEARDV